MEVTKIAGVSAEEKEALIEAGKIIGTFAKALEAGEINQVNEETLKLFNALKVVVSKVVE